jgi:hypothetical protein
MTRPSFLMMNLGMAPTAQGQQVFQSIVPQFLGRSHTSAINVMDMQIFRGSAVLTREIVPLQSFLTVAAKLVIVLGFTDVFLTLGVFSKRLTNLLRPAFFSAVWAMLLRARRIGELSSALDARNDSAYSDSTLLFTQLTKMKNILLLSIDWLAVNAALLRRAGGLVKHRANNTLALLEAIAGLTMSSQCTRFTSLQVGRCLGHLCSAVGAIKDAVFPKFHSLNSTLLVL